MEDHFSDFNQNSILANYFLEREMGFSVVNFGGEGVHSETRVISVIQEVKRFLETGQINKQYPEMLLLKKLYESGKKIEYIGITKLCCAHCHLLIKRYGLPVIYESPGYDQQIETFHLVRGYHGNGYKWPLSQSLMSDPLFLEKLLGSELFSLFTTNKKLSDVNASGKLYSRESLALACIEQISLFTTPELRKLNPLLKRTAKQKEAPDGSIGFSSTPAKTGRVPALFLIFDDKRIVREGEPDYARLLEELERGQLRAFRTLLPPAPRRNEEQDLGDELHALQLWPT